MCHHLSWLLLLILWVTSPRSLAIADLQVVTATYQNLDREEIVDGVVEAVKQATLTAQTSGQVLEVNFDVEDFVKAGDVIVRLKSVEQTASLVQSKAHLAEAEAQVKVAEKEYNRLQQLYAKHAISAGEMDKATADWEVAKAHLNVVQAEISQSHQQVEYTSIKAPYSGIVLERYIQPGEIATIGHPIMSGFSLDELRTVATVPQSLLGPLQQHLKARIMVMNPTGKWTSFKGENITIQPHADPQTHTFKVRINFPEQVNYIYPGMFTKVAFFVGSEPHLLIPTSAVAYRGEVRAVYIVKAGQLSMRQIRAGRTYSDKIEVLAGLQEGEAIAINPIEAAILLKEKQAQAIHSQPLH